MRHSHTLIISCAFASSSVLATDRVVSPNGTYPTISSAIAASGDGDRILVTNGTYNESITIPKALTILPEQEGGHFTLNGKVVLLGGEAMTVNLAGVRMTQGLSLSGPCSAPTKLQVVDSYASSIDVLDPFLRLEAYRDTIETQIRFSSGSIIGNCIVGNSTADSGMIELTGSTSYEGSNHIIGNKIGGPFAPSGVFGLSIASATVWQVENNFIEVNNTGNAVLLNIPAHNFTVPCTILNNTLRTSEDSPPGLNGFLTAVNMIGSFQLNLCTANNAYVNFPHGWIVGTPGWSQLIDSHNYSCIPGMIDEGTGAAMVGGGLIDAGDPDPRYLDLDLTTNDVGCYGGSNSRANFTTPMGSAVVGFMNAPRVVAQGDAVNINAVGFDR